MAAHIHAAFPQQMLLLPLKIKKKKKLKMKPKASGKPESG
jgi:hypothetical protein